MLKGFQDFILRGNVVDLAVGVVIGGAFGTLVTALVEDLLTPFLAALVHAPDFSGLYFTINESKFMYGHFLNALISFALVAAAVYFFVVVPMNTMLNRFKKAEMPGVPTTKKCPECHMEVPVAAKRCAHCTSVLV